MPGEESNPTPRRRRWKLQAAFGIAFFLLVVGTAWYLTSARFNGLVRSRVVARISALTGGRAFIGSLNWKLSKLEFEFRDVTIHGTEGSGEEPLLHVDRVLVDLKVFSFLSSRYGVRFLQAERPTLHLITHADGSTNIPHPPGVRGSPIDDFFAMQADRALIVDGLVLWNERRVELDLRANDLQAQVGYASAGRRYDGSVRIGSVDAKYGDLPQLAFGGDLDFALYPAYVDLKAFHVASGNSRFDGSGKVENFAQPTVSLAYRGSLDLRQFSQYMRYSRPMGGVVDLQGSGVVNAALFTSQGNVVVHNGDFSLGRLRIPQVEGGATFDLSRDRLQVRNVFAHALGGTVTGNAVVENWSSSTRTGKNASQHGSAHVEVRNFQLATAARFASSASMPLDRIHAAGTVDGTVALEWNGSPANATATMHLEAKPAARPGRGEVPLSARLDATYNAARELLQVRQSDIATPATHAEASGSLGASTADLKVSAGTSDFAEAMLLLGALGGPSSLPIESAAPASFNGTVSGPLRAISATGHVAAQSFVTVFDLPTQTPASAKVSAPGPTAPVSAPGARKLRMKWDRGSADLSIGANQITARNLVLQRGSTRVDANLQAALSRYRFTDDSPFSATVSMLNADVGEWTRIAGVRVPLAGSASLTLAASGTAADPRASGRIRVSAGRIDNEPIQSLTATLSFRNQLAEINDLRLVGAAGTLRGSAAYQRRTGSLRFDLNGDNIDLAKVQALQSERTRVAGQASVSAQGSGTTASPVINAHVRVEKVVINGEQVGNIALDAVTQAGEMRLTGSTRYQNASLLMTGTVGLTDGFPAQLHLTFARFDIDPLLRAYLQGRVTGHSAIAGDVRVQGPLRNLRAVTATGELTEMTAEIEKIRLTSDGPVRFGVANEELRLERLHIVGDETDVTGSGTLGLAGARRIDASGSGHFNLQLIQTVNPAFQSSGRVDVELRASGTLSQPLLNGRVAITNAAVAYIDLPNGLSAINGTLTFSQDRLTVEQLKAKTGGGGIELGGYVTFGRELALNVTATGRDIRLRYPPGVSSTANIDLRLTGTPRNSQLSGDVTVTRFGVAPNFDFSTYLATAKQQAPLAPPNSPLNNLHLDVHILSTPELQVQTSLAKLSGDVDLRVRGTAARPALLGRVNIVQGDVYFNATRYHLERGDISFTNPTRIDPILNIEATARVRDYDVTLGLHGPIERMSTTYRSEPPLPTADVIALLAFGRTREESVASVQSTVNTTDTVSNAILGQALNAVVSNRVQKLFGVSRIKIDPQVGTATSNPTARVTIEQQVSNKITLTYITDVTQSQQQVIQMEYNVNRSVSIVAVRDQYGVVAFDVRIRQRKK